MVDYIKDNDNSDEEDLPSCAASISATQNVKQHVFNINKHPDAEEIKKDLEARGLMKIKVFPGIVNCRSKKGMERHKVVVRKHGEYYVQDGHLNAEQIKEAEYTFARPQFLPAIENYEVFRFSS